MNELLGRPILNTLNNADRPLTAIEVSAILDIYGVTPKMCRSELNKLVSAGVIATWDSGKGINRQRYDILD